MPEITVQRTGELIRKLYEILMPHSEGLRPKEALGLLASRVQLTDYEKGRFDSGAVRFDKIIRFATIDHVKAAWLLKEKGRWTVTEAGREAYQKYKSAEEFQRQAVKLYQAWRAAHPVDSEVPEDDGEEPGQKAATINYEQAEEQAWDEIEQYLKAMNPYEFQKLVAALLRAMGYHVSWVAPPGRDGGVDILAFNDPLGTRPPRIKVQVKRESNPIRVPDLRSFMALLGDDDVGIFVNVGGFTKDAEQEARTQESRQVTLIDLERLFDLWVEHLAKFDQAEHDRLPLRPIYFLAPET